MAIRVTVVGAGAIGLAAARELALDGHEVFVLERASHPGAGITSRNSEVLHAGLYYAPESLKARTCIDGRRMLLSYLASRGVGMRLCGKFVVAVDPGEVPQLEALHANAVASGAEDLCIVDGADVRRAQPAVRALAAIWSPGTGILDSAGYVRALRADLERAGGVLVLHATVCDAVLRTEGGYTLTVDIGGDRETFECDAVVNAAGLQADVLARMPLLGEGGDVPSHRYVRGSYARLWWPRDAVRAPDCLVYPLPDPSGTGLGIHLTVDLAGGVRLGPDTEPLVAPIEDYAVSDAIVPRFEAAARRYLDLPAGSTLTEEYAGIRPVRSDASGSRDFYVAEESTRGLPGWVNCLGIESPGLTASPAIGRLVASLIG